jgi:DNA repair protein RadC
MVYVPLVKCVREGRLPVLDRMLTSPGAAAAVAMEHLALCDREHVAVLLVNARNALMAVNTATVGTLDECLITPREVFKPALILGAASLILAHNHPSGDPTPSAADFAVTDRLCDAGRLLGIPVLDHVIVAGTGRWVSLRESGRCRFTG